VEGGDFRKDKTSPVLRVEKGFSEEKRDVERLFSHLETP